MSVFQSINSDAQGGATIIGEGVAGTPAGGVLSIQGVAGGTAVPVGQSGTWTVQQGATPTSITNAWPFKLTDGVNTTAVKAASTAALATDPSAVVALSPNSPIPTGTNSIGTVGLNAGTQNIGSLLNITGTISLPTLASTSTKQSDGSQKTQIVDGSGNVIASTNNQLDARDVINVGSQYRAQSVTTTAAEALGAATILVNRKFISITPTNGTVYWGTNSSVTSTTGSPLLPLNTLFLSFTDNVHVWLIGIATTDVRILEGS